MKRGYVWAGSLLLALALGGCGGISMPSMGGSAVEGEHFVYHGHDFGPARNETYRKGVVDGCKTADGDYSKDHALFKSSVDYKAGWEHGRLHCVKGAPKHD